MATLSFYPEFISHRRFDANPTEASDYLADDRSFFAWLGMRFVSFFTFNRQGGLHSLLWQWMYYFNRETGAGMLCFMAALVLAIAFFSGLVLGSVLWALLTAPIATAFPTMLAIFSSVLPAFLIGMITLCACTAITWLAVQVYALASYFSIDNQWRKTRTVTHFILSTVLADDTDINRINTVASAINVIKGNEKRHCVYEMLNTLRCSDFTQTSEGIKRFVALINAFAQQNISVFAQYRFCNYNGRQVAVLIDRIFIDENMPNYGIVDIREGNDNAYVPMEVNGAGAFRNSSNTTRNQTYKFECLIATILQLTNDVPANSLTAYQCEAIKLFITALKQDTDDIDTQIDNSTENFRRQFNNQLAIHPVQNTLFDEKKTGRIGYLNKASSSPKRPENNPLAILYKHFVLKPDTDALDESLPETADACRKLVENLYKQQPSAPDNTINFSEMDRHQRADLLTSALRNTAELKGLIEKTRSRLSTLDKMTKNGHSNNRNNAKKFGFVRVDDDKKEVGMPGHFMQFKAWFNKLSDGKQSPSSVANEADQKEISTSIRNQFRNHSSVDEKGTRIHSSPTTPRPRRPSF